MAYTFGRGFDSPHFQHKKIRIRADFFMDRSELLSWLFSARPVRSQELPSWLFSVHPCTLEGSCLGFISA